MRRLGTVAILLILSLGTIYVVAQTETGTISGAVTDPSGAVVTGATVSVVSLNTNATRTTTTSSSGLYAVSNLQPGPYRLTVEASGFAKSVQQFTVYVGSRTDGDVKLSVAAAGTSVEVTAVAETVRPNTETQTLSSVVTAKQIADLPTLTRNPYDLVGTSGNVSPTDPSGRGAGGYAINGQRAASTDITLDGAENVDLFVASVGQTVPLDTVQEFRVSTSNFTAEYGRAGGGVVNVATKSGTNSLHGTAYEFNRVSALAANTYDNNALMQDAIASGVCSGTSDPTCPGRKGLFTRNQFGYSVGGPVKKNKLFFFQGTEWTRIRSSATLNRYVVDPAFLALPGVSANTKAFFAGVPSALRSSASKVGVLTASQVAATIGSTAGSPFASLPGGTPVLDLVNFTAPRNAGGGTPSDRYSLVGRGDWNISDKTTLFGRYALEHNIFFPGSVFSALDGYDSGEKQKNQNFVLSMTHVFKPTVVSQTRFNYNRLFDFQPLGKNPVGPTLYIKGGSATSVGGIRLNLPGYLPESPGNGIPFGGPQNVYQVAQDVSWTHGSHQFRFGAMYLHMRDNRTFGAYEEAVEDLAQTSVSKGFDALVTGQLFDFQAAVDPQGKFPCLKDKVTGAVIAAEIPNCTVTLPVGPPAFNRHNHFNELAFYGQDSWKIFPRLTLNLGLRWEYFGVQHNIDEKLDSNFYFGTGATLFERIRSGAVFTVPNSPLKKLWEPKKNNFAPRVGFAWDVFGNAKTSLRGGYGIAYERNFGNVTFNVIQNPPNYAVIAIVNGTDVPANSLPVTPNNAGPLAGTGSKQLPATSLRAVDPNIKQAYAEFWSLALEHEVARNTMVSMEYAGSRGVHLYDIANINRAGGGHVLFGDASLSNRPDNQYGAINFRGSNGFSNYNALTTSVRTNNFMNSGWQFNVSYTYSHAIDNLSSTFSERGNNFNLGYTDPFNPSLDKGNADFDLRHRLSVSGIWDVPFFKSSQNKLVKHALGGWEFAPIYSVRTGIPYTMWDCESATSSACTRWSPATGKPTFIGGSPVNVGPNDFTWQDFTALGNTIYLDSTGRQDWPICTGLLHQGCAYPAMTGRNAFRGPSNWNLDLGIYKNFKITERFAVQFRGELYNMFNHHNYYIVDDNTDVGSTFIVSAKKGGPTPGSNTQPTATGSDERRNVQFALKIIF